MTDRMIFNHHSLPFEHPDSAEQGVPEFIKICITARKAGITIILIDETVDPSWFRIELAPGYYWQNWYERNKSGPNRDLIRAFRSIATQSPFFSIDDINNDVDLFEVTFNGSSCYTALKAAVWHESPLLSFATRHPWNSSPLNVEVSRLDPVTGELQTENTDVDNFFSYKLFQAILPELLKQRQAVLSSGKDILEHFNELYPDILLCGKARQQLERWSGTSTLLNQVKEALSALNEFAGQWKKGIINSYSTETLRNTGCPFQISGESETVRNNPDLRREREFYLPDGRKKLFEQHIKMSSGYRLHFFPDNKSKRIYVGYIGPHLRLR